MCSEASTHVPGSREAFTAMVPMMVLLLTWEPGKFAQQQHILVSKFSDQTCAYSMLSALFLLLS